MDRANCYILFLGRCIPHVDMHHMLASARCLFAMLAKLWSIRKAPMSRQKKGRQLSSSLWCSISHPAFCCGDGGTWSFWLGWVCVWTGTPPTIMSTVLPTAHGAKRLCANDTGANFSIASSSARHNENWVFVLPGSKLKNSNRNRLAGLAKFFTWLCFVVAVSLLLAHHRTE